MKLFQSTPYRSVVIAAVVSAAGVFMLWSLSFYAPPIFEGNLQKFYEITKKDPFLYDPAMDVEFLRESVKEMRHTDDLILYVDSLYRPNGPEKYRDVFPEGWRLWPDEFLAVLPDIHNATADFLSAPTTENALVLLAFYDSAARKYEQAINLHIQAMENVFHANPKAPKTKILFLGSGTTPEIVYNDFLLIKKNADALRREIAVRQRCLLYGRSCNDPRLSSPIGEEPENAVVVPFDPLPKEILGMEGELGKNYFGPYWADTGCFGRNSNGQPLKHPFYAKEKIADGDFTWQKPFLTNEKYYRDYTSLLVDADLPPSDVVGGEQLLRTHNETNDYLCTDLRYLPHLIAQSLQNSESNLLHTLPHLIQNTLFFSWFPVYHPLVKETAHHPLYLLVNRGAYSLYFVTFSPAVWRVAEEPQFLLQDNLDLMRRGYLTYRDLIERGMSPEEIVRLNLLPSAKMIYQEELVRQNASK